jgi:hypothetical protein
VTITPGPFAPTVIHHVLKDTVTTDRYGDEAPQDSDYNDVPRTALADYPGESSELDNAAGNTVNADRVLVFAGILAYSAQDQFTASNGRRYKVVADDGDYVNPSTGTAVTQVNLRRIT